MTRYSLRYTIDSDYLLVCGETPQDFAINRWTVLCDGEVACIATLVKSGDLCILNSDFNQNMTHSALSIFRISCYIVEEALKYEKDIIAYGDINPSKYLLKLGFKYVGQQDNLGVYRL